MNWNTRYLPPDPNQWRGRADTPPASSFFQIMQVLNLLEGKFFKVTQPTFALIGFRCDEGVRRNSGRIGAAEGPAAIRHCLAKLPVHKQNFHCFDVGSIACADGDLESSQAALADIVELVLRHDMIPIVIGGGHELAWGQYQGINQAHPNKNLGIVNMSAYFDMRPLLSNMRGSSGTPFLQIALAHKNAGRHFDFNCIGIQHTSNIRQLFSTAHQYDTKVILADDLHLGATEKCADFINRIVDQNEIIYLSLSLDVFSASFAPGVSASQPLGLLPWHIIPLVRQLAGSGKLISFDLSELAPRYDVDQRTSKLAAMLIYEFVHHYVPMTH